ncbi:MAG TPA: hypothetical protein ENK16_06160 [Chromatiales bacterium]|nr:hypothetical protein [Chromatiales bacterium]
MSDANQSKDETREDIPDVEDELEPDGDDVVPNTDNVGATSVELDVNQLIAEMEAEGLPTDHLQDCAARKRLEELLEEKRISESLADFEDFEID